MSDLFLYDVFLSHSSADKDVVRDIAQRLQGDGLRVFFDESSIEFGDSIPAKVDEGLESSQKLILFMSANAFGSDWVTLEQYTHRFNDPMNRGRTFLTVRLDDAPLKSSLRQFKYIDWRSGDQYARLLKACRGEHGNVAVASTVPLQLPPSAEQYFGRRAEQDELIRRLRAGLNTVVVGPAGMGKTALAAEALLEVVGKQGESLPGSPFPDGIVFLDLYTLQGQAEPAWNALADAMAGTEFLKGSSGQQRACSACREKRLLVICEGMEEADGRDGHTTRRELLKVLSSASRTLLLTRDGSQALTGERLSLTDSLSETDAGALFDSLSGGRVSGSVRERILILLDGHPLALTWAGHLLARGDEDPRALADEWESQPTLRLTDPLQSEHTLGWLFERSIRRLDGTTRKALNAAGLLARAPFPTRAIKAALGDAVGQTAVRDSLRLLTQRGLLRLSDVEGYREFTHVLGYGFARGEMNSDPEMGVRLAAWFHQELTQAFAVGSARSDATELLQHAASLLRSDVEYQFCQLLAASLLYDLHERMTSLGRSDLIQVALQAVLAWLDIFSVPKANEPVWQRERSVCLNNLGDLAVAQGILPEAQRLFSDSLRIRQRLTESDPGNTRWQRDLSVSLDRLGDLAVALGNLSEAQRLFSDSLRIAKRLTESDPGNTDWQHVFSVSLDKLGNLAVALGNLSEAQRLFSDSLRIRQRLAESDPGNTHWQRDLWVSYERTADVLEKLQVPEAIIHWRQALKVLEKLVSSGAFVSAQDQSYLNQLRDKVRSADLGN